MGRLRQPRQSADDALLDTGDVDTGRDGHVGPFAVGGASVEDRHARGDAAARFDLAVHLLGREKFGLDCGHAGDGVVDNIRGARDRGPGDRELCIFSRNDLAA